MGTPSFHACHQYGGLPMIAMFWSGKKWIERDICQFNQNEFIGASYFYGQLLIKSRKKP